MDQKFLEKYTFLNIKDEKMLEFWRRQTAMRWNENEIDWKTDKRDFLTLNDKERKLVTQISVFFAVADGLVGEVIEDFPSLFEGMEYTAYYDTQKDVENLHNKVYTEIVKIIIGTDPNIILNTINEMKGVLKKRDFVYKYKEKSLFEKLIANVFVEGLFFQGSFAGILWLDKQRLCNGITLANKWISRDENLHCIVGCYVANKIENVDNKNDIILSIAEEALKIEEEFIEEIFSDDEEFSLCELRKKDLLDYIRKCYDNILIQLNLEPKFPDLKIPEFMEFLNYDTRDNFFETTSINYSKKSILTDTFEVKYSGSGYEYNN